MLFQVPCFLLILANFALSAPGQGRNNIMRLAREDKSFHLDFSGTDVVRNPSNADILQFLGGGELIRILDPLSDGQMLGTLKKLASGHYLNTMNRLNGRDILSIFDILTDRDFTNSLNLVDGVTVSAAIERVLQDKLRHQSTRSKKTLDPLRGMSFGMSKRANEDGDKKKNPFDSLSGSTFGMSKRDFDEIDNVGFTGFAKRGPYSHHRLALAKKNFDEIDRAGFETYNKRNFDEIDRAGFETFEKRDRKE